MTLQEAEQRIVALEQKASPWVSAHWQVIAGFLIGIAIGHFL